MKVLLINTSERIGGAAVACSRLMEALNKHGIKAKMLVRDKQTDSLTVIPVGQPFRMKLRFLWERFLIWLNNRLSRRNLFAVDIACAGIDVTRLPEFQEADIIHLHWVNQGMLSLKGIGRIIASGKPLVWTMHDMWPCTGICHHARACVAYREECHDCPYLSGKGSRRDLSTRVFRRKQRLLRGSGVHLVACSHWLEALAGQSALVDAGHVCSIPNPLNTSLFCPGDKKAAREALHLPADRRLILFASVKTTDRRKGMDYLIAALQHLADKYPEWREQTAVALVGGGGDEWSHLLPFPVYSLGYIREERRMITVYQAVDLFVTPSLEENLPNTIMEAMACGVPCVGFHIGGIPEMIDHRENGYVAAYRSAEDFAEGIRYVLTESDYPVLSRAAVRKVAACYSETAVARRYVELYNELRIKN